MPAESFEVTYNGPNVGRGTINVYDLAPALLAIGDLIRDADRLLNSNRTSVELKVNSDFVSGSFGIHFVVEQLPVEALNQAFSFASVIDARALVHALFGAAKEHSEQIAEATVAGLIGIYKLLHGEKPKVGSITIQDNHGTINIDNRKIEVDAAGAQLYLNDSIRADIDQVARSVAKDGIRQLEISQNGKLLDTLGQEDVPFQIREFEMGVEDGQIISGSREALVKVVTANFENGKWRFSDGTSKFNATMADPVFQQKLDERQEGFYKGDLLRVKIRTDQMELPNGKIKSEHVIQEVLEHRQTGQQDQFRLRRGEKPE